MEDTIWKEIDYVLLTSTDLFAWNAFDMLDIDPNFIFHKLAIFFQAKPVAQRKRKIGEER